MPRKEYNALAAFRAQDKPRKTRQRLDLSYIFTALLQIFVALGAMTLVVYFGYHTVTAFTSSVTTTPAYTIEHSAYTDSTAYIIRDESPIKTSFASGFADYRVSNGERVGKGEIICDVYPAAEEALREQIAAIDGEIALLEDVLASAATSGSISAVGKRVSADYSALMSDLYGGELADAVKLSDSLRGSLTALAALSGEADNVKEHLTELKAQRAAALTMLGGSIGKTSAPSIGYFFSECDGYERVFTPELVKKFSTEAFYTAVNTAPEQASFIGKIVHSAKWYVASPMSAKQSKNYTLGQSYRLTFPDNGGYVIKMTLEKFAYDEEGGAILLFSSSDIPADFLYMRAQRVRVEYRVFNGYRIPIEAVRHYDGMTGVYTLHGGYVYFRRINVLYEGEGYYIVSKYADIEKGKPKTFRVLGFNPDGVLHEYDSIFTVAEKLGLEKTVHNNGGTPLKYGYSAPYFYHLADLEEIIIVGNDLYHGKVLN